MGTHQKSGGSIEPGKHYALRFISGKYQGGEFPLVEGKDIVVGRSSELEMVLVEEMVSRKHAVFRMSAGVLSVEDLGSTNGTFVNGERIEKATLAEGDRVPIGTSILKVVASQATSPAMPPKKQFEARTRKSTRPLTNEPRQSDEPPRMTGSLEEIPLPDLLQLFGTSKKTGVLVLRSSGSVAKVYLDQGRIRHAEIDTSPNLVPNKAVYRLLNFVKGQFELDPPEKREFASPLDLGAQEVLMEGFRQQDELGVLKDRMPSWTAALRLSAKRPGKLRELSAEDLDWIELAFQGGTFGGALDLTPGSDLEGTRALLSLIDRGWIVAE
jgi:hypothetical protein